MTMSKQDIINTVYGQIVDNVGTPYILVQVDARTRVPMQFVRDGRIVMNISMGAVSNLMINAAGITFSGRFANKHYGVDVPLENVLAIYARENGEGIFFETMDAEAPTVELITNPHDAGAVVTAVQPKIDQPEPLKKPGLRLVK
jgi:stringent starvation protein B